MLTTGMLFRLVDALDCCPFGSAAGRTPRQIAARRRVIRPLYTHEERRRRDASPWTVVQGVLAPVQFIIFLASLGLVLHFLLTGTGESAATFSIIVKTLVLYTIMVTGSIWEHEIFGRYLFTPAFFWEDVVSMLVLALHTAYLAALISGALGTHSLMLLALAAYATYVFNAAQFVLKLRAARRPASGWNAAGGGSAAALGLSQ
ncbi:MAG: 2-vinyl bacteriochlorophyllide hydratase [Acetobacteraceae bacterium]|nr:2-vinyl bacteriochlorophyllide hydratase [Acetobacteraceae bacterium]